ncbi:tyrosine-type recombinase/integrase [Subtercola boreus]|nr:site-specific integrase [Subtercola boreus]
MADGVKGEGSLYEYRLGYRAYITVKGKRKYFYFPGVTKKVATQKLRALLGQRDDGTLPRGKDYTLAQWMRHWLSTAKLKPAVHTNYQHNVEHYIVPQIGHLKLSELEPEDLERLYDDMLSGKLSTARLHAGDKKPTKRPLTPRAVINVHSNIRRSLTVAMQRGHVGRNVAQLVEPPQATKADTRALSVADAKAVLAQAKADRYAARWYLGLMFGLRPAEVLGLGWEHVDFTRGVVKVRRQLQRVRGSGLQIISSAKTDSGWRDIPVPPFVMAMLAETREQQMVDRIEFGNTYTEWAFDDVPAALVFTQPNGRPLDIGVDTRGWRKLLDAAGLPHERRYIGRHTAASIMIDMGEEISVVSSILGHSKTSFTYDTYVHPMEDTKRATSDRLGAFFAGS